MKELIRYIILLSLLVHFSGCTKKHDPLSSTKDYIKNENALLATTLEQMIQNVEGGELITLQELFKKARTHYKHTEYLTEYYFPPTADILNGPALDEAEEYDDKIVYATGFQVVEEYIFPSVDPKNKTELLRELRLMLSVVKGLQKSIDRIELTEANVIESIRLQLLRTISLGISGFDSPVALHSLPEAIAVLNGLETTLEFFEYKSKDKRITEGLKNRFSVAKDFLKTNNDFSSFDRAGFITNYINPLHEAIIEYQDATGIKNNNYISAIDLTKNSFFDSEAIQEEFFVPVYNTAGNEHIVELGRTLFFDPILSGNNKRSCASCHQPNQAFTDGKTKSIAFDFKGEIARNSPTLINASFQKNQFYDSRVVFLEDQITDVIANEKELHGSIDEAAAKLKQSMEYDSMFVKAFDTPAALNNRNIQTALASYIRSLKSFNSPFDRYMRGDKSAMTEEQVQGFNVFMGKAKCGTCHFLPLFNGTVPPSYMKSESEILGVPKSSDTINAELDRDLGKFHTYKRDLHKNAFKTPTIRNAALTAPYMHNGVYKSLEEVIDFYNKGGGIGLGINVENQTLPPDKLNLSANEKKLLVSFIESLTDTTRLTRRPIVLPKFSNQQLSKRMIGGDY